MGIYSIYYKSSYLFHNNNNNLKNSITIIVIQIQSPELFNFVKDYLGRQCGDGVSDMSLNCLDFFELGIFALTKFEWNKIWKLIIVKFLLSLLLLGINS